MNPGELSQTQLNPAKPNQTQLKNQTSGAQTAFCVELQRCVIFSPTPKKAPSTKRLCGRGCSLALGLYGAYRRRHQHERLRARAPAAPLRGRDVFRSEKSALQPTTPSLLACDSY